LDIGPDSLFVNVGERTNVTGSRAFARLVKDGERIAGAFGYIREDGRFVVFEAPAVILATGGIGKTFKVTSNSWEYTGDGHALALLAGAKLLNMEFVEGKPVGTRVRLIEAGAFCRHDRVEADPRADGGDPAQCLGAIRDDAHRNLPL
jgi:succinate dehydrogenase/fumarate reductase flavoprotein subunit